MQGGGPESLRSIDSAEAAHKYGVTLGASMKRDIDFIIEQLIASIPGILIEQLKVAHPGADDVGLWIINIPDRENQVQIESSEGSCPFLIESDFNDERFHGHTVQEVVVTVKRLFSLIWSDLSTAAHLWGCFCCCRCLFLLSRTGQAAVGGRI